ncbi:MAG: hypothetical protein CMD43_04810 [Gammaproteobacteria bacterium]|nr:hypothetical protein [Gammaproteobacteria bacterium]
MNITPNISKKNIFKVMNFDHLMQIYENNYYLFRELISYLRQESKIGTFVVDNHMIHYELITSSKYTDIFRLYHKYRRPELSSTNYSIKPHLIFTLYKDAKLLEVKSLSQSKYFDSKIDSKLKINLDVYYWLKGILIKNHKYQ